MHGTMTMNKKEKKKDRLFFIAVLAASFAVGYVIGLFAVWISN